MVAKKTTPKKTKAVVPRTRKTPSRPAPGRKKK